MDGIVQSLADPLVMLDVAGERRIPTLYDNPLCEEIAQSVKWQLACVALT